jgi:hypothetical protein
MDMKVLIFVMLAVLGCSKTLPEKPVNECGYKLDNGMTVYEQNCDPGNLRNVGEPVCIEGNIIVDCVGNMKQYTIKEVLRWAR